MYNPRAIESFTLYNSPEELGEFFRSMPKKYIAYPHDNDSWAGGSFDHCVSTLNKGDASSADKAQKIFDKLLLSGIEAPRLKTLQPSVVGFMPIVPNVIAGVPDCMWKREETDILAENTPVTIYVDVVVSSGITTQELFDRGVAILALTMALSTIRPIDLYAVAMCDILADGHACGTITRIETRPLDLARASWMLTSNGFARRLMHSGAMYHRDTIYNTHAPFCWGMSPNNPAYVSKFKSIVGMTPEDIFIPGGWLYDNLMKNNPVAWVNKMIEQHINTQCEV